MMHSLPKFTTLGCRLNAYETEAMKDLAAQAGMEGAVVVNTCAVTAEAVRKARQEIRKLRRDNPRRKSSSPDAPRKPNRKPSPPWQKWTA